MRAFPYPRGRSLNIECPGCSQVYEEREELESTAGAFVVLRHRCVLTESTFREQAPDVLVYKLVGEP